MKNKLIWRLDGKPTVEELKTAIEAGIITKEEAKSMLVRTEEEVPTDQLSEVKDKIKFLEEMMIAIGKREPEVIKPIVIKEYNDWIYRPHKPYWWNDSIMLCNSSLGTEFTLGTNISKVN
jgi:hypothetical protein